ncbi:MAG: competence/damage-inducible protein A [Fimbriimonadaceae bacterium]|nr:MAG: competence/damage-inducible protein A [Fimbriimonadaceae bacterium]
MRAEVISVGTELLLGQTVDTNSAYIGTFLAELGVDHTHQQTVGDNFGRLVSALELALSRADIVITIGGLGPTQDDLTRDGIAAVLNDQLIRDEAIVEHLKNEYGRRGLKLVESQYRQADRPAGGQPIPNLNGTAPGLICTKESKYVIALPGPPREFIPMLEGQVREFILSLNPGPQLFSRTLRVAGIGEGTLCEILADLMEGTETTLSPYAKTGEVHLRASTKAASQKEADIRIDIVEQEVRSRIGDKLYAVGNESLEEWIVKELTKRKETVATAESCTGGLLAARITSVSGASKVIGSSFVTYSAEAKQELVGVKPESIAQFGTVSSEVAEELAIGARLQARATYGIGITGVAGSEPLDEPPAPKPSGLVYIGISTPAQTQVHTLHYRGSRELIRERAVVAALIELRNVLLATN